MSLPNYYEARYEMNDVFEAAFNSTEISTIMGYQPDYYWDGIKKLPDTPPVDKLYAVFRIKGALEEQVTLQGDLDGNGSRRFNNAGLIMAEFYSPLLVKNHFEKLGMVVSVVRSAFAGHRTPGGVVFNNVTPKEIGPDNDNKFYLSMIVADYNYDTIS